MSEFHDQIARYRAAIEAFLQAQFCQELPQKRLFDAMRYSLLAGGKRIRPVLTLEFCRICGGDWQSAVPFACALEMIHTYSLIHDDLPCMDNDDYRRGRLTNHKVFGEALAVLAGDGLLTAAFETAANAPADPAVIVRAIRILSEQAGELGMVGGQVLDMQAEEQELTEQGIYDIQRRKTGALIQAACQIGVVAGGGTEQQLQAAGTYAQNIGLAAQALGVGSVWLGTWPQMDRVEGQRALLSLPETVIPHSIIALGYPAEDITASRESRYDAGRVHFGRW